VKELAEQKTATLALLGRLFPALDSTQSLDHLEKAALVHIKVRMLQCARFFVLVPYKEVNLI
jgi:hypothetical protein